MIVNGFNSDNYRYFRNKETGKITKYSLETLERVLLDKKTTRYTCVNRKSRSVVASVFFSPFDIMKKVSQPK